MRFYFIRNETERTLSGKSIYGKSIVLSPDEQRWIHEEDLINLVGLNEAGEINASNISISASADFTDPITIENADIDIDSDEVAQAIYGAFEDDVTNLVAYVSSSETHLRTLADISNATIAISGFTDEIESKLDTLHGDVGVMTDAPVHNTVSVTNSATKLCGGTDTLSGRRLLVIHNISAAVIYLGGSSVTTSNGLPLLPNEKIILPLSAHLYGIAASGTNDIRVMELK